ncbi:MAG: hypothetical protein DRJ60_05870, partial [Thermoprotei archaeon]
MKLRRVLPHKLRRKLRRMLYGQVIDLASGDPDYQPPPRALKAAIKALKEGVRYTDPNGLLELREKIAETIEKEHKAIYDPKSEIIITYGASEALYLTFNLFLKGATALIPSPHYPQYREQIAQAGGQIATYPFDNSTPIEEVAANIKRKLTRNVKLIIINSPHNPTGRVLNKGEVEALAEIAQEGDALIVWDEVYSKIIFEGRHHTLAEIPEAASKTIFIGSFSKTYGMTGWRVGYIYGPQEITSKISSLHRAITFSSNPSTQIAALEALKDEQYLEKILRELRKRREALIRGLKDIEALELHPPQGSLFAFPRLARSKFSDKEFAELLLKEGVKVDPGYKYHGEKH